MVLNIFINENIGEASQKEIDILMKTLDVNLNGQINLVEYAARAKEFVKKRILLTYLLRLKARGKNGLIYTGELLEGHKVSAFWEQYMYFKKQSSVFS